MKLSRSEQARVNGAKSKGPKTPEGRDKCAQANLTHGAYAARISALPFEDREAYAEIWDAAMDQFQPRNYLEFNIVCQYVDWEWAASRFIDTARHELRGRIKGFRTQAQKKMGYYEAHRRAQTECPTVDALEKRSRAASNHATRLIRKLMLLRELTVSREATQDYLNLKEIVGESIETTANQTPQKAENQPAPSAPRKPQAVETVAEPGTHVPKVRKPLRR
jgi:hypothetical protein